MEARIVIWSAENTLKCNSGAFFRYEGGWAAYRIVKGRAQLTPVELGHNSGRETEIVSGLSETDELIAYPGDQIVDDIRVQRRATSRCEQIRCLRCERGDVADRVIGTSAPHASMRPSTMQKARCSL